LPPEGRRRVLQAPSAASKLIPIKSRNDRDIGKKFYVSSVFPQSLSGSPGPCLSIQQQKLGEERLSLSHRLPVVNSPIRQRSYVCCRKPAANAEFC
jgi:hypothetical protein